MIKADLSGKKALVTGASSGIGKAVATLLAQCGATVAVNHLIEDKRGPEVVDMLNGQGCQSIAAPGNVADPESADEMVAGALERLGGLDILINNAGVVGLGRVDTTDLDEWNRIIGINLTGTFLGIRHCVESMKKTDSGVIVNISSTAGLVGYCDMSAYVASKWGVRGLTKSAALDLGRFNIRVVSIHPGIIETEMAADLSISFKRQAIPRIGQSEEVAQLMLYLVSEASYSTGSEFVVDGGQTLGQVYDLT